MNSPVYTFGPMAHPASALSLRDALIEMFPNFGFNIELMSTLTGTRETVTVSSKISTTSFQHLVMFAQGFVAGFGGGITPPTKSQAIRRSVTRADCPVAKRKSDPPPPSAPTLPSQPSPSFARRNTIIGVAPPSRRA